MLATWWHSSAEERPVETRKVEVSASSVTTLLALLAQSGRGGGLKNRSRESSNLSEGTRAGCSSMVRVAGCEPVGCGFESRTPPLCGSSSVGRARACQVRGRGIVSPLPHSSSQISLGSSGTHCPRSGGMSCPISSVWQSGGLVNHWLSVRSRHGASISS